MSTQFAIERPNSLWAETAPSNSTHPPLQESLEADVTIIGAGFTGLRAALTLSEAGAKVAVLDAGDVAYGASGRTGGQINPMLPFNTPATLRKILGTTYFERLTEASLGSANEVFKTISDYQIECQARQKGWLRVMHNPRALKDARAGVEEWNRHGANMSIIGREEVKNLSGTAAYEAGVVTPMGGAVQPMSFALGLADAAKQRGCMFFGDSAVLDIEQTKDAKWTARTALGKVTSNWVIIATNGYSGDLVPALSKTIIPITPIQIATDPLPDSVIGDILPNGHTISDSRRIIMYARREPDNRMVYGGHGRTLPNGELRGADWIRNDAVRVFPQLKNVKWTHTWGGRIAITEDYLPHLHEPKPGILVGLGYNGRGVAMANVMGRVLAERALGASSDALTFPTSPVKEMSLRLFKVAGMGTAIWFMRLLDYLETR